MGQLFRVFWNATVKVKLLFVEEGLNRITV